MGFHLWVSRVSTDEILPVGRLPVEPATTQGPVLQLAPGLLLWSSPLQIEKMPAQTIGGVALPEYDAAWLKKQLDELDLEEAKVALQPTADRLKLIGAIEKDFEL